MKRALSDGLPSFALFGGFLAFAGLPIYIYAPPFYAETYGVSLTGIAAVLFFLRLFDAIQDPFFGWLSERIITQRARAVAVAVAIMAASIWGLFAVAPPVNALAWFALTITGLFSAFSFLSISFYAQGVTKAAALNGGHLRLAAWRESGALLGVCIAATLPAVLAFGVNRPFAVFALIFGILGLCAVLAMRRQWAGSVQSETVGFRVIWNDPVLRRLLILAFVNAAPVAVSSTMFLFFVTDRLNAAGWEGLLLVLFFFSGALSAPMWSRMAARHGAKRVLLVAMITAVVTFTLTLFLGNGDVAWFALVCITSGATIGADLTLLPAMFATRLSKIAPNGGQGFGLWSFVNKATLAFAAIALFPILEAAGFDATRSIQPDSALKTLTILYALVPLALKLFAIALLTATDMKDG